jgi:integrase/recombinase XerD
MTSFLLPVVTGESSSAARLRVAVAAHLARYRGLSREHTASDVRVFLVWCAERNLDPLPAQRAHLELYVRWSQEVRRFKPSTVSRRTSVVCGFYRTCVIDGLLEHSPARWLRRPTVPPESPTLGLTHLQFEPLLSAAREPANRNDFALVAMLVLLGVADLRGLRRRRRRPRGRARPPSDPGGRQGHQVVLVPLPPAVGRAIDRAVDGRADGPLLRNRRGRADGPPCRYPPADASAGTERRPRSSPRASASRSLT